MKYNLGNTTLNDANYTIIILNKICKLVKQIE